ncbi:cell envelope integrity protein CreD [Accumulibacter sp.]|uniref:cell envelope integrity protein CreD n=1 Tax=Accumulibacter sp. TaxID=2053492 RepID=UPI002629323C|nr:cell envelope integrity protein CreD [Accumulibacter sp.]
MDKKLLLKLMAIGFMSLLLLVPLALIENQIRQRSSRQDDVQRGIANSAAGQQTLTGPVLAIHYRERLEPEMKEDPATRRLKSIPRFADRSFHLPAENLRLNGEARVETRQRGIYQVRLYHLDLAVAGRFVLPARLGLDGKRDIVSAEATLLLGVSDPRGVDNDPAVTLGGKRYRFSTPKSSTLPGDALAGERLAIPLGNLALDAATTLDFDFPLQLTGSERLAIAPTGEANTVDIKSDWRHPSFGGRFLPRQRTIADDGFTAHWEVSHLARNFPNALAAAKGGPSPEVLDILFVDPVNIYLQAERAVKYGILFIALTFAGFFLSEVLRRSPIHPLQYLLVGLALAVFFLLLIALSEHLPFLAAYAIAAAACIGLIGTYLAGALGDRRQGFAFAGALTGLYGVLYGVLLSEDNSLLMGSVLLFLALGAIMLATRRIDWYRIASVATSRPAE